MCVPTGAVSSTKGTAVRANGLCPVSSLSSVFLPGPWAFEGLGEPSCPHSPGQGQEVGQTRSQPQASHLHSPAFHVTVTCPPSGASGREQKPPPFTSHTPNSMQQGQPDTPALAQCSVSTHIFAKPLIVPTKIRHNFEGGCTSSEK